MLMLRHDIYVWHTTVTLKLVDGFSLILT